MSGLNTYSLGLVNKLFTIVNNEPSNSPNSVLAQYFLENYDRLRELNIYMVADECFVSRSSIRRFCQNIGYDNFKDLKNDFKDFKYEYNYFMSLASKPYYRNYFMQELDNVRADINALFSDEKLDYLATMIHDATEVVMISAYNSINTLAEFQRPMILSGRLIKIMNHEKLDSDLLYSMDKGSLVIVVSAMGHFAELVMELIGDLYAHTILLTTSYNPAFNNCFDEVFYLSQQDHTNQKSVNGKYGISVFFDLLYGFYLRKYGSIKDSRANK